jgi:hypothetical protein
MHGHMNVRCTYYIRDIIGTKLDQIVGYPVLLGLSG